MVFQRWRARRQSVKELRTQEEQLKAQYLQMKEAEAERGSKQQEQTQTETERQDLPRYDEGQKHGQQITHHAEFTAARGGNVR